MTEGIIIKALSGFYYVDTPEGVVACKARGRFRLDGTSPLVGDRVSDGKTSRYETFLNISSVKGVKLDKRMATGVSL